MEASDTDLPLEVGGGGLMPPGEHSGTVERWGVSESRSLGSKSELSA